MACHPNSRTAASKLAVATELVSDLRNTTEQNIAEAFSTMVDVRQLCSVVPF